MLAVANDDRILRRHFHGERKWTGFRLVERVLLIRTELCLTSLWDKPRDDTASLPTVVKLIRDSEVLTLLRRDVYERPALKHGRLRRKHALDAGRMLRCVLPSHEMLLADPDHREQLRRLRRQRNEHLAHALFGLEPDIGPRYRSRCLSNNRGRL